MGVDNYIATAERIGEAEMSNSTREHSKRRDKERVQLDFSTESLIRLDQLKERIGATTRAETIRQALRLFEWFVDETEPGSIIEVTSESGELTSKFKASLLYNETRPM